MSTLARCEVWDWLESLGSGISRSSASSWTDEAWPGHFQSGINTNHGLQQAGAVSVPGQEPLSAQPPGLSGAVLGSTGSLLTYGRQRLTSDILPLLMIPGPGLLPGWDHPVAALVGPGKVGRIIGVIDKTTTTSKEWRPRSLFLHMDQNPWSSTGLQHVQVVEKN